MICENQSRVRGNLGNLHEDKTSTFVYKLFEDLKYIQFKAFFERSVVQQLLIVRLFFSFWYIHINVSPFKPCNFMSNGNYFFHSFFFYFCFNYLKIITAFTFTYT